MLATITTTGPAASDLSFLLHKHPGKLQTFELSVGDAHVFYPEATDDRCTVAILLEVDPIGLVRNRRFAGNGSFALAQYVNDRPYASSSMLAVALRTVFSTAMTGKSEARPERAAEPIPLEIHLTAVPSRGELDLVRRVFEPLGWQVDSVPIVLDSTRPDWGDSRYVELTLRGFVRLSDALRQLYVLLPVLDDSKHYWVSDDEVGKLMRSGEGWLPEHPERELITKRYLVHQRSMVEDATARLVELDGTIASEEPPAEDARPNPLSSIRADAVMAALQDVRAARVADVGCGPGALLKRLGADPTFTEIIGTDVSSRSLEEAERRLNLRDLSDRQRERFRLLQSSLTYEDDRIVGVDAIVLMEVIEHIDPSRHEAVEHSIFSHAKPNAVIVTTPNAEYNVLYPRLAAGTMRHPDHRFEWTRAEFATWAEGIAVRRGYRVEFRSVGEVDDTHGSPTQLALFRRELS